MKQKLKDILIITWIWLFAIAFLLIVIWKIIFLLNR